MGDTTEFKGQFDISPPLTMDQYARLCELAEADPGGHGEGAPDGYLQWVPTRDGKHLKWDGNEKFYDYAEWLQWLARKVLAPWGCKLTGEVKWQGEDRDDRGVLRLTDEGFAVATKPSEPSDAALHQNAREMHRLLCRLLGSDLDRREAAAVVDLLDKIEATP